MGERVAGKRGYHVYGMILSPPAKKATFRWTGLNRAFTNGIQATHR